MLLEWSLFVEREVLGLLLESKEPTLVVETKVLGLFRRRGCAINCCLKRPVDGSIRAFGENRATGLMSGARVIGFRSSLVALGTPPFLGGVQ